jgi:hypothetical protein
MALVGLEGSWVSVTSQTEITTLLFSRYSFVRKYQVKRIDA